MRILFSNLSATALMLASLAFPAGAQDIFFPESEWRSWSRAFAATVDREARVEHIRPRGSVAGERTAMAIAREVWSAEFGRDVAEAARPYRAFLVANQWLVTGTNEIAQPGDGPILVLRRDSGAVVMLRPPQAQAAIDEGDEAGASDES